VTTSLSVRQHTGLQTIGPAHWAATMATGILATDAQQQGIGWLSDLMLALAAAWYLIVAVAVVGTAIHRPRRLWESLVTPATAFGFFTFVTATSVLGAGVAGLGWPDIPLALWLVGATAWCLLTYRLAITLTLASREAIWSSVSGSWLLTVVETQALVVLGATLAARSGSAALAFACTCLWFCGLAFYGAVILLILARILLGATRPEQVTPDYWICMGALAITDLAGVHLVQVPHPPALAAVSSVVGLAIAAWSVGTAWIPWLVWVELRRLRRDSAALEYEVRRWSTIFPLGMYGAASFGLGAVLGLPALEVLGHAFFWLGLACWAPTAVATVGSLAGAIPWRR
jgi:tellurite resistance protein TehA-like permease